MAANWKRWLLSSGVALAAACGDDGSSLFDRLGDGGNVARGDGSVSSNRDGGNTGRDGGRDGSSAGGGGGNDNCGVLMAVIRDFTPDTNPDFEKFMGTGATTGIVKDELDDDYLPVFNAAQGQVTNEASFDQWYRTESGVNQEITVPIPNQSRTPDEEYSYASSAFFPIDNRGFGNYADKAHNFHFTTQIAASFIYRGGEVFEFEGDDDLWIFVNGKLALDLGGLHEAVGGSIDFDALATRLGLTRGKSYRMDIFHAERHTDQSNFKFTTTISCFLPPIVG